MIVPMKKVSLIILGDQKSDTLQKLRKLGILHIEISEGSGERLEQLKEQASLLEGALFGLAEYKKKKVTDRGISAAEALDAAKDILSLTEQKKALLGEKLLWEGELDRLQSWGELDPQMIAALAEKGVDLALYEIPKAEYEALGECVKTIRLEQTKTAVRCLLVKTGAEGEEEVPEALHGYRVELPKISTEKIRQTITDLEGRIQHTGEAIACYADCTESLKKAIAIKQKEIEFEVYASGMADEHLSQDGKRPVSVACFKGYVEADNLARLQAAAKENAWGLIAEDPTEEDDVPTKLKNNKFVSLIYPLTDFLGTIPGYFEYDISGWFLFFILIFFGMIFGDGGYGLLVTAVAAIPIIKALIDKKPAPPTFLLVALFGISTIVWGTLTCTWFGLSPAQLPEWLKNLSIPVISNVYADKIWYPFWTNGQYGLTTAQNLQIFCFSLALVQLVVAHIKGALRNKKSIKVLADIGSILQLVGMFYVVLSWVVNAQVFSFSLVLGGIPVGTVALILILVGFVLTFVFSNYEGSIIKSILASLANIVSVLLGVVNVFSDIVSYIRLWAVGLAGTAISSTVNDLAGPLFGNFLFMIFAIILLVFGHGLNMILNVLSVIVHGIRLNTLEFSSHLDMYWSGHKFKSFEE